jgi:hypothetical protein
LFFLDFGIGSFLCVVLDMRHTCVGDSGWRALTI